MRNHILMIALIAVVAIASQTANADEGQTKLQSVIRQFDTNAIVVVESGDYVYRYHIQTFKIHTIHKTGAISEIAHDEEGPNVDGIFLKVSLQDGPYRGAAEIPQDLHRPYWTTFINAYPVADGKYLWLSLSYGSRADKKLMEAVKTCFGPILPPEQGTINQKIEHSTPPVVQQPEWKPRVFERESDNPQLWLATVNALHKAGVSYNVIRIKEMQWSAQPYYLAILEGTNGITLQCTVGGRIGEPFSYVTIDLKHIETPQPPPGN